MNKKLIFKLKSFSLIIMLISYIVPLNISKYPFEEFGIELAYKALINLPNNMKDIFGYYLFNIANFSFILILPSYFKKFNRKILIVGILGVLSTWYWLFIAIALFFDAGNILLGTYLWVFGLNSMVFMYFYEKKILIN